MTIPDLMPEGDIRRLLTHAAAATGQTPPTAGAARARRTARTRTATHAAGVIAGVATVAIIIVGVPIALALTTNDTVLQPQPAAPSTHQTPTPSPTPTARSATTRTPTPSATPTITTPETTPPPQPGTGSLDGYIPLALAQSDMDPDDPRYVSRGSWSLPMDPCWDGMGHTGIDLPGGVLDSYSYSGSYPYSQGSPLRLMAVVLPDRASAASALETVDEYISLCGDPATAPEGSSGSSSGIGTWTIVGRGSYGDEALLVHVHYYPTEEAIAGGTPPETWDERHIVIVRTGNVVFLWDSVNQTSALGDAPDVPDRVRTQVAEELAHLQAHLG